MLTRLRPNSSAWDFKRAAHLLKSHADEFGLNLVQKLPIRMFLPRRDPRSPQADRVFSESFRSPTSVLQQFWTELRYLLGHPLFHQMIRRSHTGGGERKGSSHTIVNSKRLFGIASLDGIVLDNLAIGFRKCL